MIRTKTKQVQFSSVADYVRIQLSATPLATLVAGDEEAGKERVVAAVVEDVGAALRWSPGGGRLSFPQELHILLARSRYISPTAAKILSAWCSSAVCSQFSPRGQRSAQGSRASTSPAMPYRRTTDTQ